MPTIELSTKPITEISADTLVVGLCEGEPLTGHIAEIDKALDGVLSDLAGLAGAAEMSGKRGETAQVYTRGKIAAGRVMVVGLGKRDDLKPGILREAAGAAVRRIRDQKLKSAALLLHGHKSKDDVLQHVAAITEGALLGLWDAGSLKTGDNRASELDTVIVAEPDTKRSEQAAAGMERGRIMAESANFARDLVNAPPNDLTPVAMADRAKSMAVEVGLSCEIIDEDAMYRMGMGAILAVSVGSENRARLIVVKHTPNPGGPELALIGKGITFDTGGISIKPREGMEAMKGDMAGAAAVIGAMRAISLLKLPVNVVGLAPCAENMPSGKAFRPGDVIRCMNGKTVEIISTDAEGRMVLADALTYAIRNLGAPRVVDVATLTGACVVALGTVASGAMTNNPELLATVRRAAESADEKIWELPLFDEYKKQLKSDIADLKNSGGRNGGAITAGWFLREFTDDKPWVHLDIAGPSTNDKPLPHMAKGASGVMVRTFVQLAEDLLKADTSS